MIEDPDFPYTLSGHALTVHKERAIPLEWIARVVEHPERVEPDRTDPELQHALARILEHDGRVLRVVYNVRATPWRIVTVYFDRNQRNRL